MHSRIRGKPFEAKKLIKNVLQRFQINQLTYHPKSQVLGVDILIESPSKHVGPRCLAQFGEVHLHRMHYTQPNTS